MKSNVVNQLISSKFLYQKIEILEELEDKILSDNEKCLINKIALNELQNASDDFYKVLLFDLLNDNSIVNEKLSSFLLTQLTEKGSTFLKLSILDYLFYLLSKPKKYKETLLIALSTKQVKLIIKNQIILHLIALEKKYDSHIELLIKNLKATKDYRGHIRVYNTLLNNKKIFKELLESKQTISTLMQISSKNQKGRAVQKKLKEFGSEVKAQ